MSQFLKWLVLIRCQIQRNRATAINRKQCSGAVEVLGKLCPPCSCREFTVPLWQHTGSSFYVEADLYRGRWKVKSLVVSNHWRKKWMWIYHNLSINSWLKIVFAIFDITHPCANVWSSNWLAPTKNWDHLMRGISYSIVMMWHPYVWPTSSSWHDMCFSWMTCVVMQIICAELAVPYFAITSTSLLRTICYVLVGRFEHVFPFSWEW